MEFIFYPLGICVFLLVLWLFAIKTAGKKADFSDFENNVYAHRGLFEKDQSIPENSLAAFKRAVEHGVGVEFDLQLTSDGQVVVFHDKTLERMCGIDKPLYDFTFDELQAFSLADTSEKIPLFSEVLDVLGGKVPAIVEIKNYTRLNELCEKAYALLKEYDGIYCIESFHPIIVRWFKKNAPDVLRGQLSMKFDKSSGQGFFVRLLGNLQIFNLLSRPHFISYNFSDKKWFPFALCVALYRPKLAFWTIRSQEDLDECKKMNAMCIFEHFIPKK